MLRANEHSIRAKPSTECRQLDGRFVHQIGVPETEVRLRADADEAAVIKSVCEGNAEAFYPLVLPYERMIIVVAMSVLKNLADAEEVAQEAVLKAFCNFGALGPNVDSVPQRGGISVRSVQQPPLRKY